ncbi:hypothetical protein EAS64_37215 [Trebonia kvetii]|uniref:Uncharacterized protein n=1 Tax=Trebonia kvetii TaxID=2480626 RepID=A0A6P2BNS3_9ACTN|nr:hypothetical protein [Trebonia kvetii]TVZ00287.1 hypothetical protein EAS64_37215 [Trebonia kvetii]
MRVVPDGDGLEWHRRREEQARRQVTELVPRPGCPIYGLAAPPVRPVTLDGTEQVNGDWTQITLGYGPRDASTGPYLRVTTAVTEAAIISASLNSPGGMQIISTTGMHGIDPEAELRHALREEAARTAALPPGQATTPSEAPRPAVTRERLPAGDALIVSQGTVWAARLVPDDAGGAPAAVTVTIVGRDVAPEDIRLETLADLREAIEGRTAEIGRIIAERRRQPPVPPPELEPAEGVAALRALADFISAGRPGRPSAARSDGAPRSDGGPRSDGAPRPRRSTTWDTWRSRRRGSPVTSGCARRRSMRRCGTRCSATRCAASPPSVPGPRTGPGRDRTTRARCGRGTSPSSHSSPHGWPRGRPGHGTREAAVPGLALGRRRLPPAGADRPGSASFRQADGRRAGRTRRSHPRRSLAR